ncbi:hypothetical protein BpHYR1_030463 [Brachionus plicatilis]|uniref:Uncharacterized protein n=1 Tax=Brachionus plicatilis TaxID=10195 RepID=A0A3M7RX18_BRAPC|nr:hypothetical protein BpHYR1_030463 [Brachionus plicatilis]
MQSIEKICPANMVVINLLHPFTLPNNSNFTCLVKILVINPHQHQHHFHQIHPKIVYNQFWQNVNKIIQSIRQCEILVQKLQDNNNNNNNSEIRVGQKSNFKVRIVSQMINRRFFMMKNLNFSKKKRWKLSFDCNLIFLTNYGLSFGAP